jgi:hypothetical protein
VSHITSFLILHELTAIIPLIGLAATFHYTNWLPEKWTESKWVEEGTRKWSKYMQKKGWISEEDADLALKREETGDEAPIEASRTGVRLVVEVATAYAIVKVFLPARILASVAGTPWFARRVVGPVGRMFGGKGV